MPRRPPEERIAAVAKAATEVFGRRGFRGTATAEVAARAGISAGALFTYVESKEALFHLVFAHGFGQYTDGLPGLPLGAPPPEETLELIERGVRRYPVPRLQKALKEERPHDVAAEVRGLVEERYEMLEQLWPLLAVIERCAPEMPKLEHFYFARARVGYHARLARYLEARASIGLLRSMPDAAVAAQLISESIAWFAWHRREGRDAALYDDEAARRTVIEFVCSALVVER
jgi:AcrR family transcriptional regulator